MATVVLPAWKLAKRAAVNTQEPLTQPSVAPTVNTNKTDRHKPGYMANYMRQYRKRNKAPCDSKA